MPRRDVSGRPVFPPGPHARRHHSLSSSRLIAPSRCAGCGGPRREAGGGGFCPSCWKGLPRFETGSTCPRCAIPTGGTLCRGCAASEPPVERAVAFGPYEGGLKRLVHAVKFQGYDIAAAPAGALLADAVRGEGIDAPDAVVAVPSTRRRNRERGYDPGALLAEELGRRLSIRLIPALARVRETPPQSALGASERRSNVAGAFRGRPIAAGRSLLLVDDVMTTGATAFAAAGALRDAGARRVDLAILARTPEPEMHEPFRPTRRRLDPLHPARRRPPGGAPIRRGGDAGGRDRHRAVARRRGGDGDPRRPGRERDAPRADRGRARRVPPGARRHRRERPSGEHVGQADGGGAQRSTPISARRNLAAICRKAAGHGIFVRLDMEDTPYTEKTIRLALDLKAEFGNVGTVLQAYLRRSLSDLDRLGRGADERPDLQGDLQREAGTGLQGPRRRRPELRRDGGEAPRLRRLRGHRDPRRGMRPERRSRRSTG